MKGGNENKGDERSRTTKKEGDDESVTQLVQKALLVPSNILIKEEWQVG
jgi:hypothetical protein